MLQQCSARDVNLRGIFLVFGGLIVAAITRPFPSRVCRFFIVIIGRRLWRCSVFTSLLLLEQLKKAKEEMSENLKNFRESAKINSFSMENNLGKLSTGDVFHNFPPAGEPKFSYELGLDSEDVFIRSKSQSARSIRKLWKFLTKLHKISAVEIVEQLQNTFD
jgi:hypothetical protein